MSFPAEIQGGIPAQLADCFVGFVCQRLEFLSEYRLRVSGVRNPAAERRLQGHDSRRSIQQISNVLQTGGEQGMWNFDRYQRWIAQKTDWVQPTLATPLPEERLAPASPKLQRQAIAPARAERRFAGNLDRRRSGSR